MENIVAAECVILLFLAFVDKNLTNNLCTIIRRS